MFTTIPVPFLLINIYCSVVDPNSVGSASFRRIRIQVMLTRIRTVPVSIFTKCKAKLYYTCTYFHNKIYKRQEIMAHMKSKKKNGTTVNKSNKKFRFSNLCKTWCRTRVRIRTGIKTMPILNSTRIFCKKCKTDLWHVKDLIHIGLRYPTIHNVAYQKKKKILLSFPFSH